MSICFSNTSGRRFAVIDGGKFDGEYIYLYDERFKCCTKCGEDCEGDCCDQCAKLEYHIQKPKKILDYCGIDDEGVFKQVPTNQTNQRDALFICGKAGSGKSVYLSEFCKEYKDIYPKQPIFLFSMKESDDALDEYVDKRINLKEYVASGGLTESDFRRDCCVLFDDIDVLDNSAPDKLRDQIFKLMNALIQISRSKNITIAQTSHICTNHGETKHMLNGMTSFTFFINSVSMQIKRALEVYAGLSKASIKKI
ncbi:MAG: ATP-binding protein, partial [Candidatus Falkowbacteria bacterium]